jgi:hypothetical protein
MAVNQYDSFISYNNADRVAVAIHAHRLRELGLSLFIDLWEIVPGDPFQETIETALNHSATCIVFLGATGLGPWQNEEVRIAIENRVNQRSGRVIPVILPGMKDVLAIPSFLRRLNWIDLRDELRTDERLKQLVAAVNGRAISPTLSAEAKAVVLNHVRADVKNAGVVLKRSANSCSLTLIANGETVLDDHEFRLTPLSSIAQGMDEIVRQKYRFDQVREGEDKDIARIGHNFFSMIAPEDAIGRIDESWTGWITLFVDERLAYLPWQILHTGRRFIKDYAFVGIRILSDDADCLAGQSQTKAPDRRPRILVMLENVFEQLVESGEAAIIRKVARAAGYDPEINVVSFYGDPEDTILAHLSKGNDVIHLGASHDKMYLRSRDGYFSEDVFAEIVSHKPPALILQMICGGGFGPSSIKNEITPRLAARGTAFISSNMWMHFEEAKHFTASFYLSLFAGKSIGEAFQLSVPRANWYGYRLVGDPEIQVFKAMPKERLTTG